MMHFLVCVFFVSLRYVIGIPVIIDTDIGYSTDDVAAVAIALQRPEIEVKLIVTATGDTEERARILAKFLHLIGREDIPLGIGINTTKTLITLAEWADDFDLKNYKGKVYKDGVKAMASVIEQSNEQVSIMAIAPPTNIFSFLQRFPDLTTKANVKAMSGSIYRGYQNSSKPVAEYNALFCTECTKAMYTAPWDVTISPLDTCGVVSFKGQSYSTLLKSSEITALAFIEVTLFWAFSTSFDVSKTSNILYDAVSPFMMMVTEKSLLEYEELPILVTDEGRTVISKERGTPVNVALYWKEDGLLQFEMWMANTFRVSQEIGGNKNEIYLDSTG